MSIYDNRDDLIIGADNVFTDIIADTTNRITDVGTSLVTDLGETFTIGKKKIGATLKAKNSSAPLNSAAALPVTPQFKNKVNPLYIVAIAAVLGAVILSKRKK